MQQRGTRRRQKQAQVQGCNSANAGSVIVAVFKNVGQSSGCLCTGRTSGFSFALRSESKLGFLQQEARRGRSDGGCLVIFEVLASESNCKPLWGQRGIWHFAMFSLAQASVECYLVGIDLLTSRRVRAQRCEAKLLLKR